MISAITAPRPASIPISVSPTPLLALGLTPREAEDLLWVAQGKSNADVGALLNKTEKTVNKHLSMGHVFAVLGSIFGASAQALPKPPACHL